MIYAVDITKKNISMAINFCLPHEEYAVNLVSFLKQEEGRFFKSLEKAKLFYLDKEIIGVASVNNHNFFIYCFSFCNEEILKLIASTFNFNLIYAIMGEAKFQKQLVYFLSEVSNIETKSIIQYILMTKFKVDANINCHTLIEKLKIAVADKKDVNNLLDLQIGYEKEEVCQGENKFPKAISFMNLEKILKNEITYFARIDNLYVAKANTNAQGINYAQIGGVYTLPEYRGRGIASCVVASLIKHINKNENKNASLFVKLSNKKAIEMYKRLGFKERGKFHISYLK